MIAAAHVHLGQRLDRSHRHGLVGIGEQFSDDIDARPRATIAEHAHRRAAHGRIGSACRGLELCAQRTVGVRRDNRSRGLGTACGGGAQREWKQRETRGEGSHRGRKAVPGPFGCQASYESPQDVRRIGVAIAAESAANRAGNRRRPRPGASRAYFSAASTAAWTASGGIVISNNCSVSLAITLNRGFAGSSTPPPLNMPSPRSTVTPTWHSYRPAAGMRSASSPRSSSWYLSIGLPAQNSLPHTGPTQLPFGSSEERWRLTE